MKQLEKKSSKASNKGLGTKDSDKKSSHSKESDDERRATKDRSLASISAEHIQNLIANTVKAHLGGDSYKTYLYKKPYTKRVDAAHLPHGYQPPKFRYSNHKQHIAYFIETCSNAATKGD